MTAFYVWLIVATVILTALAWATEHAPYDPYVDTSRLDELDFPDTYGDHREAS